MDIEMKLDEYSREEILQAENDRLREQVRQLSRRVFNLQRKQKEHKRIISKQNKRIQGYEEKQMYINVNKGPKKRR